MMDHCIHQVHYYIQHVQAIHVLLRISEQLSVLPQPGCLDCATQGIDALVKLRMALLLRRSEVCNQIAAERIEIENVENYIVASGTH